MFGKKMMNLLAYEQSNYLMGRTIPSFRIASVEEQKEWKEFRQALDKSDRKAFDDMFSMSHLYNSACSFTAKPIRIHPIFMSIIFYHYKELMKIKEELEIKEKQARYVIKSSAKNDFLEEE